MSEYIDIQSKGYVDAHKEILSLNTFFELSW